MPEYLGCESNTCNYSYDAAGNRFSPVFDDVTTAYWNGLHQKVDANDVRRTSTIHDAAGNNLAVRPNGYSTGYNSMGQMITVPQAPLITNTGGDPLPVCDENHPELCAVSDYSSRQLGRRVLGRRPERAQAIWLHDLP